MQKQLQSSLGPTNTWRGLYKVAKVLEFIAIAVCVWRGIKIIAERYLVSSLKRLQATV
jgi:hypothetical protein